ncbi:MAG: HAD family hydrolase [Planctomycetota bacterium]
MLILFDIDGTLLLSRGASLRCFREAGRQVVGRELETAGMYVAGGLDPLIWRTLCERNGLGAGEAAALHEQFRASYGESLRRELDQGGVAYALPGVAPLLDALEAEGRRRGLQARAPGGADDKEGGPSAASAVTIGLLTGNYPETGRLKLRAAGIDPGRFSICAWGDEGGHRRDLVPLARRRDAERRGAELPFERTVIIGDTPQDVDCARHHGCRVLGVGTGMHPVAELLAAGATHAVPNLSDTPAVLEWLLG